jgi:pilus assembly protein Flp/PilA
MGDSILKLLHQRRDDLEAAERRTRPGSGRVRGSDGHCGAWSHGGDEDSRQCDEQRDDQRWNVYQPDDRLADVLAQRPAPLRPKKMKRNSMFNLSTISLCSKGRLVLQTLLQENGQDLVEYAAVIVIVVLAITAGMHTLANAINNAMTNVGTYINSIIG